eukprot:CAMPEP_0174255412 /NCGR_PEP_ID=MMETSP0439-20130205/4740_1 /TAXON_ID=0 /ORGANISM="Stereomyxa ramosa, Strain Chinc5" /LENGTH=1724 /DNA_ID=CAMNT_0015337593 /DNA_START=140 /DNA_END=5314 /DNA_ORIENTATION=+
MFLKKCKGKAKAVLQQEEEVSSNTTNLLYGYNPAWLSEGKGNNALFEVEIQAVEVEEEMGREEEEDPLKGLQDENRPKGWGPFPLISLHESAESLLDKLLPYQVEQPQSPWLRAVCPPCGALLVADKDHSEALAQLSDTLGVNLERQGVGFVLVRLVREDSSVKPKVTPLEGFLKAAGQLYGVKPRGAGYSTEQLTPKIVNEYLRFFEQVGTHYVSKVTLGDVIFQVFSLDKTRFEKVKAEVPKEYLSGHSSAVLFREFTTDKKTGRFGYVLEYGKILSYSNSPVLRESAEKGKWLENTFAVTNSIFAPFQDHGNKSITTEVLNQQFLDVTPIMTTLNSLSEFIEHSRHQTWVGVFKAAIVQKFPHAVEPCFVSSDQRRFDVEFVPKLNQTELPGFLSNIATPFINTYKPSLCLSELSFAAPEVVKTFTLCSNLVHNLTKDSQAKTSVQLPGKDVLIVAQMIVLETQKYTTSVEVSDEAFDSNHHISVQKFRGGLLVCNASHTKHYTIADGLKYTSRSGAFHRSYVHVTGDIRGAPPPELLPRFISNVKLNYSFLQGRIRTLSEESPFADFLRESMLWITQLIPKTIQDTELLDLRVRALDFSLLKSEFSQGSFVPVLSFSEYTEHIKVILSYVQEIDKNIRFYHEDINMRKLQELTINAAKDLNKNIIQSGKLLSGFVQASLEQQKTLSDYYSKIINDKRAELQKQEDNVRELQNELDWEKEHVNRAIEQFKNVLITWRNQEIIKFALEIATSIFNLSVDMILLPEGLAKEVTDFAGHAKKVKLFFDLMNSMYKIYSSGKTTVSTLLSAQKSFDSSQGALSTDIGFEELTLKLSASLSFAPSDKEVTLAKENLLTAFKIMVLKAKALSATQSKVKDLARDIYGQLQQRKLLDDQVNHLKQLDTNLNPRHIKDLDINKIDLIGMTGSLSTTRSSVLGILVEAFTLYDQSLQYEFLQQPTPINSFDILDIKSALVTQSTNTTTAKTALRRLQETKSKVIDVSFEVPAEALRNGKIYAFEGITVGAPEFAKYVTVRVHSVVASIRGIKSTDSGEYLLKISYPGRPFFDRGIDRQYSKFNTLSRSRIYDYEVGSDEPQFSDSGDSWSEGVNAITPFSTWHISLPDLPSNKGLQFSSLTVLVTLSFVVKARIDSTWVEEPMFEDVLSTTELVDRYESRCSGSVFLLESQDRPLGPEKQKLFKEMESKSVLNGWDVVFNMDLYKINNVMKEQYEELKKDKEYGGKIEVVSKTRGPGIGEVSQWHLQKFKLEYGFPYLDFLIQTGANTNLEMLLAGSCQLGSLYIADPSKKKFMVMLAEEAGLDESYVEEVIIDGKTMLKLEHYNKPTILPNTATLQAVIQLQMVSGVVKQDKNIHSVILDMSVGSFTAKNIEIEMDDTQKLSFSEAIKAYFVHNPVYFLLASLDTTNISHFADLTPSNFLLKAHETKGKHKMLQLYIQTGGRPNLNYTLCYLDGVEDPLPEDCECSLIINTKLVFGSLLKHALKGPWTLSGYPAFQRANAQWFSFLTSANVSWNIDLSPLNYHFTSTVPDQVPETSYYYYHPLSSPSIFSLAGMRLVGDADGIIHLYHKNEYTFKFTEKIVRQGLTTTTTVSERSTNIGLTIKGYIKPTITGTGRNQEVQCVVEKKSIVPTGHMSGGGSCLCNVDDLSARVNQELSRQLPSQLEQQMVFSFAPLSVFALKNLLFPVHNYINFQSAHIISDMVILGKFSS